MSDVTQIPEDRVRIFDRRGNALAEFRARVPRSWAMVTEGRAALELSTRSIVYSDALQFGNWILIDNSMLPSWVGVIDVPREWGARSVTINAFSPERVFGWRRGPLEQVLSGPAGSIFKGLLDFVNAPERTIITPGNIWTGGTIRQETINPTLLNTDLARVQERSQEEYAWRPAVDKSLVVYADWQQRIGTDTQTVLQEGKGGGNCEISQGGMVEDGPLLNDILGAGAGSTWRARLINQQISGESASLYGLRQGTIEYNGVTQPGTVAQNVTTELGLQSTPTRLFSLSALNIGNTFADIAIGNVLGLKLESMGFGGVDTCVRILGIGYNPQILGKVDLVVREV